MGKLAAILSKKGENVSDYLVDMLYTGNMNSEIKGISVGEDFVYKKRIEALDIPESSIVLGYLENKIMPNDPLQPISQYGYSFSVEGRYWKNTNQVSAAHFANILGLNPDNNLRQLVNDNFSTFAINILYDGNIIIGRDSIGKIPLYYGEDNNLVATSSNKKMLWTLGLEAHSFDPGSIGKMTEKGISIEKLRELVQPPIKDILVEDAISELNLLLENAVISRSRGLSKASLGFSGGIDSSVLAYYLSKSGLDVDLVCVGMEDSTEFDSAVSAAEAFDLNLIVESFTIADLAEDIDTVLWIIEEPDPMKISIAIPLYWAARIIAQSETKVFFSGNGSDELFGGYYRHAQEYLKRGQGVVESIFQDVTQSYRVNYERDYKLSMDMGLELRLPFSDFSVIEWGLSIPPHLKLSNVPGPRKLIIRNLARRLGLPENISEKPKKAIQYSTGVNRALKKLAKKNRKSLNDYIFSRFQKVKEENLGRSNN